MSAWESKAVVLVWPRIGEEDGRTAPIFTKKNLCLFTPLMQMASTTNRMRPEPTQQGSYCTLGLDSLQVRICSAENDAILSCLENFNNGVELKCNSNAAETRRDKYQRRRNQSREPSLHLLYVSALYHPLLSLASAELVSCK
ncbi:unnamed protein product [Pleuronectes platessa]|uniref:Uncharacterized protein n=1 Tax=Pleuronectes platessa TaxID=8262 RepID=A0A9N7Z9Z8_PLEPL|nr:unnamed protein product [Pleuronectes platessa]